MRGSTLGWLAVAVLAVGCGGDDGRDPSAATLGGGSATSGPAATTGSGDTIDPGDTTMPGSDAGSDDGPMTTGAAVPMDCSYEASDFDAPLSWLDTPVGAGDVLEFTVGGLPDPAAVSVATLHFDTFDADHPGQEGTVFVNGQGPLELPANEAWDEGEGTGSLDVSELVVAGDNVIEFGGGSVPTGNYYAVGRVRIELTATVVECPPAPPPMPLERTVTFTEAEYTERHNWVLRCDAFEYAYTAYGDEHIPTDKDGLYAPDGSRSGTAIFSFPNLAEATYEIQIRSRHTVNRNPMGALFVVDGEGKRILQDDDADFVTDIWGTKDLGGDVDVVLDSTMEAQSDSVIWVRLVPQP